MTRQEKIADAMKHCAEECGYNLPQKVIDTYSPLLAQPITAIERRAVLKEVQKHLIPIKEATTDDHKPADS
jgi:hypothetical protein